MKCSIVLNDLKTIANSQNDNNEGTGTSASVTSRQEQDERKIRRKKKKKKVPLTPSEVIEEEEVPGSGSKASTPVLKASTSGEKARKWSLIETGPGEHKEIETRCWVRGGGNCGGPVQTVQNFYLGSLFHRIADFTIGAHLFILKALWWNWKSKPRNCSGWWEIMFSLGCVIK